MGIGKTARELTCLVACAAFAAGLVPATAAQSASAGESETFSVSSGTTGGASVSCGTPVSFKVLSEPENGAAGTAQVGDGSALAISASYAGDVDIPERVEHDGRSYEVVSCGAAAFEYTPIASVTLPDTVTTIGRRSFYACDSLKTVSLGKDSALTSVYTEAFCMPAGNGELRSFYFPSRITWIGNSAFNGQTALKSVEFNCDYVDYLGARAFANCTGIVHAEIPGTTANGTGLSSLTFCNCASLESVVFKGSVLKEAEGAALDGNLTEGTRTFLKDTKLATVVYRGKKYIPSWGSYTGGGERSALSFMDSDPALYVTVSYYPSKEAAERGEGRLGAVCVRSDVLLSEVKPGMASSDAKGKVVHDGSVPRLPDGFSGWAYEGDAKATAPVSDSLYAYPVGAHDLSHATLALDRQTYCFTGKAIEPVPSLIDASGKKLQLGTDYEMSYERKQGGSWTATSDLTSAGELRAVAKPASGSNYAGSATFEFGIALAAEGTTFTKDGVTYRVVEQAEPGKPGVASVGDGSSLAIPATFSGSLDIPARVSPEGSSLEYAVTSVADHAFGGAGEADAVVGLAEVKLPETLETIGTYAFGNCRKLKKVIIPASVTSIGARAFHYCSGLTDLSFEGKTIDHLGTYAFASCSALRTLVLPGIGESADHVFASCSMLSRVEFTGSIPHETLPTRFAGCKRLVRIICRAQAYPDATESGASVYYPVEFRNTSGKHLGTAVVRKGTSLAQLDGKLTSPALLEGAIPSLPRGYRSWSAATGSAKTVTAPLAVKPSKAKASSTGSKPAKTMTLGAKDITAKTAARAKNAKTVVLGPNVKAIRAKAFKGTACAALIVKTTKFTKTSVKNSLLGSKVKKVTLEGAARQKMSLYRKCFAKSNCGKNVVLH